MHQVLIVDDDHDLALLIYEKLKSIGECVLSISGYEAINLLKTNTFDLVISDYNMHDGDGASLAHFCVNQGIQIVVVSSFPENHIRPYLPDSVPFLNKFAALRGNILENLIREKLESKPA